MLPPNHPHNIKSINDVWRYRLEFLKDNEKIPELILVSEDQRRNLYSEASLLGIETRLTVSNIDNPEYLKDDKFKLFNITISTLEREKENKMKIIWCDGYARESIADRLIAENITSQREANIMLDALRASTIGDGSQWYKIVEDDAKLWGGMEELI